MVKLANPTPLQNFRNATTAFCSLLFTAALVALPGDACLAAELPLDPPAPLGQTSAQWQTLDLDSHALEIAESAVVDNSRGWAAMLDSPVSKIRGQVLEDFPFMISDFNTAPDETSLAVGPHQVIQLTSKKILSKSLSSGADNLTSMDLFFAGVLEGNTAEADFVDADLAFSPEHNRFVLTALTNYRALGTIYLAISRTDNIQDGWILRRYDLNFSSIGITLGVDTWGVNLLVNPYGFFASFDPPSLLTVDRRIFASQGQPSLWFHGSLFLPNGTRARGVRFARPHTVSSEQASFMVSTLLDGGDQMAVFKLTGDRGNGVSVARTMIEVPSCHPIYNGVDQPGASRNFPGGDCRVADAIYGYRRIYAVWTDDESRTGSRSGIRRVRLNTDTGNLMDSYFVDAGPGARWYYFNPSLSVLGGDGPQLNTGVFFNYTQRDSRFLSAGSVTWDIDGNQSFTTLYAGNEPWTGEGWGNNSAAYDWNREGVMWGSVQYIDGNRWRTRLSAVAMDDRDHDNGGGGGGGGGGGNPFTCVEDSQTACLLNGRFEVKVTWKDFAQATGPASQVPGGSDNSRNFWFFQANNWEMLVKVLDGCGSNSHFWFFGAVATNVEYTIEVTDSRTGAKKTYRNSLGNSPPAVTDTEMLPCS